MRYAVQMDHLTIGHAVAALGAILLLLTPISASDAQAAHREFRVRIAAGASAQYATDWAAGLPGFTGTIGLAYGGDGPFGARFEYQGFLFAGAGYAVSLESGGLPDWEPRQVNHAHVVVVAGTWRRTPDSRVQLSLGPAAYHAETDGTAGTTSTLGAVAGIGVRLVPRVAIEAEYHRAALGDSRSFIPVRLSVLF